MRTRKRKALSDSAAATTTNVSEEATAAQKMTPEYSIAKHLLLSKETNGAYNNVVFSPLCIKLLLSIVIVGCNGPVRDQLLSFLGSESIEDLNSVATQLFSSMLVDGSSSGGPRLSFANGVEVAKEINSWAERETQGLINNIIDSRSIEMKNIIMANALYFKGLWEHGESFKETKTVDGEFHLLDGGGSVKVPFMKRNPFLLRATAIAHQGFKVLTLRYRIAHASRQDDSKKQRYAMHIFLPDEINGLPALVEKRLSALEIPRFKLSFMVDASPVLMDMGLVLPFSKGALTEMVEGSDDAHVSEIFQKCMIEVNEEGTKAAETGRMMLHTTAGRGGKKEPPMEFIADHPFLFMIREQITGTTLFIGQVLNPLHA
ncbi:hypothetical protein PIB30_008287 [Stylosanthes scabra]|uniref:Serpin domain-containing protein n=1 Tax=Stylosanthes scabra TaxID=79078 RepID=A0ABU6S4M7_9FABA|nr:hypothetical protein [Stylosanthes scabra]